MGKCISKKNIALQKQRIQKQNHYKIKVHQPKNPQNNALKQHFQQENTQKISSQIKNKRSSQNITYPNSLIDIDEDNRSSSNRSSFQNSQKKVSNCDDEDIRLTVNFLPFGSKSSVLKPKKQYVCGLTVILEESLENSRQQIFNSYQKPKGTLSKIQIKSKPQYQCDQQVNKQSVFDGENNLQTSVNLQVEIFPLEQIHIPENIFKMKANR